MAKIPVKKLNDGTTNYFPVSVLNSVFLNKEIEIKNTIGGLSKGATLPVNTSLDNLLGRILCDEGLDIPTELDKKVDKDTITDTIITAIESMSTDQIDKVKKALGII